MTRYYRAVTAVGDKVEQGVMKDWSSFLVEAETPDAARTKAEEMLTSSETLIRLFETHPNAD